MTDCAPSIFIFRPGSISVDFLVAFNRTDGVNSSNVQTVLARTLTLSSQGVFLGNFQLSTDPSQRLSALSFAGKSGIRPVKTVFY